MKDFNDDEWKPVELKEKEMSSKEIIHYLVKYYNAKKLRDKKFNRTNRLIKDEQVAKGLQVIKKKLEILEILKEVIKNNVFDVAMLDDRPNGKTLLSCEDFGITLKTEDYYKILRGLNDDK